MARGGVGEILGGEITGYDCTYKLCLNKINVDQKSDIGGVAKSGERTGVMTVRSGR